MPTTRQLQELGLTRKECVVFHRQNRNVDMSPSEVWIEVQAIKDLRKPDEPKKILKVVKTQPIETPKGRIDHKFVEEYIDRHH